MVSEKEHVKVLDENTCQLCSHYTVVNPGHGRYISQKNYDQYKYHLETTQVMNVQQQQLLDQGFPTCGTRVTYIFSQEPGFTAL